MSVPTASKKIALNICYSIRVFFGRGGGSFCFRVPFSRVNLRQRMKTLPNDVVPVEHNDTTNARILAISEDQVAGFVREPFAEIATRAGLPIEIVLERITAMLRAGTVRRVRQTLLATNLAAGALVAWKVAPEKIDAAFDWMSQQDPFSGHVVLRSTDAVTPGSEY